MIEVRCPHHGETAARLARGRLADRDALEAEEQARSCPDCARWWEALDRDEEVRSLEGAVGAALASVRLPRRRHPSRWAAAAALLLAVGGALLWVVASPPREGLDRARVEPAVEGGAVEAAAGPEAEMLASWSFEDGLLPSPGPRAAQPEAGRADTESTLLFSDGLEEGHTGRWGPTI